MCTYLQKLRCTVPEWPAEGDTPVLMENALQDMSWIPEFTPVTNYRTEQRNFQKKKKKSCIYITFYTTAKTFGLTGYNISLMQWFHQASLYKWNKRY